MCVCAVLTVMMLILFYSSKSMSGSNAQIIRAALVDLIKFYIGREITFDELGQIIGFICAVHDEVLVSVDIYVISFWKFKFLVFF